MLTFYKVLDNKDIVKEIEKAIQERKPLICKDTLVKNPVFQYTSKGDNKMNKLKFINNPNYLSTYISYKKDEKSPYKVLSSFSDKKTRYELSIVFKNIEYLEKVFKNINIPEKPKYKSINIHEKIHKNGMTKIRDRVTLTISKKTNEELKQNESNLKKIIAENQDKIIEVESIFKEEISKNKTLLKFSYPKEIDKETIEFYETYKNKVKNLYINIFLGAFDDKGEKYFINLILDEKVPYWKISPAKEELREIPLHHKLSWRIEKPYGNLYAIPLAYANSLEKAIKIMKEHTPKLATTP